MDFSLIISFLSASILLTLMPGPDNIFVLTESLTHGKRNGMLIAVGLASGVLVHTFAAAAGLSVIIQQSEFAFSVMKYVGAAYLFYLAFISLKYSKIELNLAHEHQPEQKDFSLIRKGFLMNILNPKVALFFIAFFPQFITKNGLNTTVQMFLLGIIFALQALAVFYVIAVLSGKLTSYIGSNRFWNVAKWSKIGVLVVLGLTLLFSEK